MWSCTTQKNTFITRTYHNITARYNILFNGRESFEKGVRALDNSYEYDYTGLLPVFNYTDENLVQKVFSDMDRTIKKCTKVIQLHSIKVKPEYDDDKELSPSDKEFYSKNEYNKYVDKAYLLMGKAHFYRHEFFQATETFIFMLSEFKGEPVIYDVKLWLAKTYVETGEVKNAEATLFELRDEQDLPKHLKASLYATIADFYIKHDSIRLAIEPLTIARDEVSGRARKIKYTYILAQLYEKTGNSATASELYRDVIKMNPPYEMTFHARINRAMAYQKGFGSRKEIENELEKMLKDDKNIEYRDQIYYALGNVALKAGDIEEAIRRFKKSSEMSTTNTDQKTRTYLSLADLYYEQPDYMKAQAYYDSAVSIIDMDYPGYDMIFAKSTSLTSLVNDIHTVELQDSVQQLARLDSARMLEHIDNIIEKIRADGQEQRRLEQERMMDAQYAQSMSRYNAMNIQDPIAGSNWYFYNPSAKNLGKKEFVAIWGNRKLEDNWRRSNKKTISTDFVSSPEAELVTGEADQQVMVNDTKSREFYLKDIPFSDSAMAASHKLIERALRNMGDIYKNELKDYPKAVDAYEELLRRYPETEQKLAVYYDLYNTYRLMGNKEKVAEYRSKIISGFPESMYAKILTNPDYIKELEKEQNKAMLYYDDTYSAFLNENYPVIVERADYALENFQDDELMPKFAYMRAVAIGKTSDIRDFKDALYDLVADYPRTEVSENAKLLIAYLDKERPDVKEEEEIEIAEKLYSDSDDEEHYYIFVVPSSVNINQLLFNIINFNLDNFAEQQLTAVKADFNNRQNIVMVKSFESSDEAMEYYNNIRQAPEIFKDVQSDDIEQMIISMPNYKILLEDKQAGRYQKYFVQHYIE